MKYFQCGRYRFRVDGEQARPLVMGILNVTPDSFSDGGRYDSVPAAISRAEVMIREGVDIIDIGAESSRPGAGAVSLQEELDRIMPVIEALRDCGRPLSVDTYKPEVMTAVLASGVDMINDICGFSREESLNAVASYDCGLCVMHMQGEPGTMQDNPRYGDVVAEVSDFLARQVASLLSVGVAHNRICIDPGFGFGKTVGGNYALLAGLGRLREMGLPVLVGMSRKSMISRLLGTDAEGSLNGTTVANVLAMVLGGASILRVHDVKACVEAVAIVKETMRYV